MRSPERSSRLAAEPGRSAGRASAVRVWWCRLEAAADARRLDCLHPDERARLAQFASAAAADRFLLGSALARTAVAAATDLPPAVVALDRSCERCGRLHGAPRLGGAASGLSLSITHAGTLVGVALSADASVGLDVEPIPQRAGDRVHELARDLLRAFHPREADELAALPSTARSVAALRVWTRKEAVLKATQLGLTVPLDRLHISTTGAPRVVAWTERPASAAQLALVDLAPAADHVAAVACAWPAPGAGPERRIAVVQGDGAALLGAWLG